MKQPTFIDGLHPDIKWHEIKKYRAHLLAQTDYTQMPDSPLTAEQKTAFADYRQQLRDLPQTFLEPDLVVWPTKP